VQRSQEEDQTVINALSQFGCTDSARQNVLRVLAQYDEPMRPEDLGKMSETLPQELVDKILHWARLLGIVRLGQDEAYTIDRLVGRLLAAHHTNP